VQVQVGPPSRDRGLVTQCFPDDCADLQLSRVAHNRPYYHIDGVGDAIIASEYWVVVNEREHDRVVGAVGICHHSSDYNEALWGDWLAPVDQEYRVMCRKVPHTL
jgi:hypothetical protein